MHIGAQQLRPDFDSAHCLQIVTRRPQCGTESLTEATLKSQKTAGTDSSPIAVVHKRLVTAWTLIIERGEIVGNELGWTSSRKR